MKERLIIISDLWGEEKSKWIINYTRILEIAFEIKFYDSCKLGGIDKIDYSENSLHGQFINGGIEVAVKKLIELEEYPINILAFSIGGTIAWKYGLISNKIISLTCVSSTRLRKEYNKPNGEITLLFGENDEFKPNSEWLDTMNLDYEILPNKKHEIYYEPKFAKQLSEKIIKTHYNNV